MITLDGKYSKNCIIYSDKVEEGVVAQVMGVLNHPAFDGVAVRIMPDNHVGAGCVIGFTAQVSNMVIPNLIGVDIGCGMLSVKIKLKEGPATLAGKLDEIIRRLIPSGCRVREKTMLVPSVRGYVLVAEETGQNPDYVLKSIGTLGGGNHFIEAGLVDSSEDEAFITIHSGSRNFGLKVALFHQKIAQAKNPAYGKDLAWLENEDAEKYLEHMVMAQHFAAFNRKVMMGIILGELGYNLKDLNPIESVHNYIDVNGMIRKGAISAHKDEMVVIPWNMRDGLIIGKGKGNSEWNNSAPHGAGRVLSRSKAKELVSLDEYQKSMEGVFSTCINQSTVDESPMAYKPKEEIEKYLEESVEIVHRVKPFYNFKASE